ncbi:MAG: hypothetical protein ABWX67_02275 [Allosphingosinicella sp.]
MTDELRLGTLGDEIFGAGALQTGATIPIPLQGGISIPTPRSGDGMTVPIPAFGAGDDLPLPPPPSGEPTILEGGLSIPIP